MFLKRGFIPKIMTDNVEGLTVRGLLKNTYGILIERHKPQEIVLLKRGLAEIADDSDYHRT